MSDANMTELFQDLDVLILWPNGELATVTDKQRVAINNIAERYKLSDPVTVSPLFGNDACVMVDCGSIVLGVETDGYTHS